LASLTAKLRRYRRPLTYKTHINNLRWQLTGEACRNWRLLMPGGKPTPNGPSNCTCGMNISSLCEIVIQLSTE